MLAIVIDDLQWADRKSVEALMFMLRRLSVDPVIAMVTYRGPSDRLDEAAQRLLLSVENRLFLPLGGLEPAEVTSLAAALRAGALDEEAAAVALPPDRRAPAVPADAAQRGLRLRSATRPGGPRCPGRWPPPSVSTSGRCRPRAGSSWRCWRC